MLAVQAFSIIAVLATSTLVSAHGHVAKWTVNGVVKAGFNPSYPPEYGPTAERPTINADQGFVSLGASGTLMACGGTAAPAGMETWDVDAGSTVTAHWNVWPQGHQGPVSEYMARCPGTTCDGVDAGSLDWFKISASGYENGAFATDEVARTSQRNFKIPSDIASGPYLVRHDIIAMHGPRTPQIYPVCFQANVIGTGSAVPKDTAKFPAAYYINPIFQTMDIYNDDRSTFVPPGPPAYVAGGASGPAAPAPAPVPVSSSVAPVSSAAAPVPSPVAPVPAPAAPVPSSSAVSAPIESEYPAEPIPSSAAPAVPSSVAPVVSSSAPSASSSADSIAPSSAAAPAGPSASSAAPVPSSAAAPVIPSSAAAPPAPSSAAPAPVTPPAGGSLGGPAPAITKEGDKFIVNGGSYNFEGDAKYASCMSQMNKCKNWANSLPNSEVGAAFTLCDSQAATCFSGSKKRDVVNRYSRRALAFF